jgi:hypothetical protein
VKNNSKIIGHAQKYLKVVKTNLDYLADGLGISLRNVECQKVIHLYGLYQSINRGI